MQMQWAAVSTNLIIKDSSSSVSSYPVLTAESTYHSLEPFINKSPSTIEALNCPLSTLSLYYEKSQPGSWSNGNEIF